MDANNFIDIMITEQIKDVFNKYKDRLYLKTAEVADIYRTSAENIRKKKEKGDFDGCFKPKHSENEHTKWHKLKLLKHYFSEVTAGNTVV